jgi:hypothetical protein
LRRRHKLAKTIKKEAKSIYEKVENHPQYLKYQRLLDQYFEIVNDDEKRQRKFFEVASQSQKLEQLGISPPKEMLN